MRFVKRQPNNNAVPWKSSPGGLQVVDMADVPPILDAYDRPDGHGLAVWSMYCRKWHVHGHGGGDRAAHCHVEDSPYIKSGYVLRPIGKPVPTFKNGKYKPPEVEQGGP